MLFQSLEFLFLLTIVLPVYYVLRRRWQNVLLLCASYFFYGWWDWRFLSLLAFSTVLDYSVGLFLARTDNPRIRKVLLFASLCGNLGLLGFFKYFGFFVNSTASFLQSLGFQPHLATLQIVLPIGISFYTFQTLAYTISVYRKEHPAMRDLLDYALYVSYFPQLVAGPIERAQRLLPQIQKVRRVGNQQITSGILLMLQGYVKKVAIADAVAPFVDKAFSQPLQHSSVQLLAALYLFAVQIYCDFSGYSDIARGVSRLFGIELMINFRQPYLAANITEFWRRWHISLSTWLRDYLYISLGGNRKGKFNTYRNLMLTMLLGGLWHGAGWTFVVWGGLHGLYLTGHKLFTAHAQVGPAKSATTWKHWLTRLAGTLLTFHLVCVAWIFFRASSLDNAWDYLLGLATFTTSIPHGWLGTTLFYVLLTVLIDYRCWIRDVELPIDSSVHWAVRGVCYSSAMLMLLYVGTPDVIPFIYFQF